jgi:F-type H+-transporting ATPase subunit gamma
MSSRRDIKGRIGTLVEINGILGAMKNLALMELQKLGRFIGMQRRVVQSIETATADFLRFYAVGSPPRDQVFEAFLLIGSERGFCGNFNETVIEAFRALPPAPQPAVVAVGRRLAARLPAGIEDASVIAGADVAEGVEAVLTQVANALSELQRRRGGGLPLGLTACYHDHDTGSVIVRRLLPMPEVPEPDRGRSFPPLLYIEPAKLLPKLVDQYLFAALHEALYSSLLAENQQRLAHMDGAMHRLENDLARLKIRYNALRQEEIIEEIEVILLSADALNAN